MDMIKEKVTSDCQKAFQLCPKFEKTFSILGKKWNGLIIDVLLENGTQRFKNLVHSVPKCSDRVLVERLKELEQVGVVDRITSTDSSLIEYRLTTKGEELAPVMAAVHQWSDKWCDPEDELRN